MSLNNSSLLLYTISSYAIPSHLSHSLPHTLPPHTLSLTLSPLTIPPHTLPLTLLTLALHTPLMHTLPSHSPRHTLPLSCTLLPVISSFFSVVRRMSGLDRAFASRVKSSSTDATILSLSLEVMEGRVTRRLGAGGVATLLA